MLSPAILPASFGIYIHVPYCRSICPFCSFTVFKDQPLNHQAYFDFLKQEIRLRLSGFPENNKKTVSIYFGGGTPSRIPVSIQKDFLQFLRTEKIFSEHAQVSFEINPEDFCENSIEELRQAGINRFSIGIQSFFDEHLRFLQRSHKKTDCQRALKFISKNLKIQWNLDLMYGFPGLQIDEFRENLNRAIDSGCQHLSLYGLTIEPGTPFHQNKTLRTEVLESDFHIRKQYEEAVYLSENAGLMQYEVSNFAKPGYSSVQNQIYWNDLEYLGFGVGAHSYQGGKRMRNHSSLRKWQKDLQNNKPAFAEIEEFDSEKRLDEFLIIAFRCRKGIQKEEFSAKFEEHCFGLIKQICCNSFNHEYLIISENSISPTAKGMLFADELALQVSSRLNKIRRLS